MCAFPCKAVVNWYACVYECVRFRVRCSDGFATFSVHRSFVGLSVNLTRHLFVSLFVWLFSVFRFHLVLYTQNKRKELCKERPR